MVHEPAQESNDSAEVSAAEGQAANSPKTTQEPQSTGTSDDNTQQTARQSRPTDPRQLDRMMLS